MLVTEKTFSRAAERIAKADDIVLDLETTGLHWWKGDRACGVAIEAAGEADYFAFRHEGGGNLPIQLFPKLLKAARAGRKTYRGWNLRFDFNVLASEGDASWVSPDVTMRDGIVDVLLLNENEPSFSLANVCRKYLGEADTKAEMDRLLAERFPEIKSLRERKGLLHKLHASEVAPYACGDVTLPRRLQVKTDKALADWGLDKLVVEMNDYSLLLARMQRTGILIDREYCERLSATTEDRKAELLAYLRAETGNPKFNPNSPKMVPAFFGVPDGTKETLRRCGHPLAQHVIDYRKLGKAKAAYYDKILELLDDANVLHPQLNLTRDPSDKGGTRSGRLSCSDPNFQACPHVDEDPNGIYKVRDLVIARPGMKLAKLDYERAEMWVGGHYSRDVSLFQAYHAGRDLYRELAARTGITRQEAKILWLMIQYGAGVWKIAEFLDTDEFTARGIRDAFFELCPGIRKAMYAYADKAEATGCIRLWTGRVCHFERDEDGHVKKPYAAWNRLVQGAVGEMVRLAMMRLEPLLAQFGARIILQVHDELVVEYPEDHERPVLAICREVMTNFEFRLRPRIDPQVGTNYARLTPYKEAA